jgi:hypothetical protein
MEDEYDEYYELVGRYFVSIRYIAYLRTDVVMQDSTLVSCFRFTEKL